MPRIVAANMIEKLSVTSVFSVVKRSPCLSAYLVSSARAVAVSIPRA